MIYAHYAVTALLFVCFWIAFATALRAPARIATFEKTTSDMDWEAVAKITGDIASVKRSIQTVNNRMNGMEVTANRGSAARALAEAQALSQVPNVTRMIGG